MKRTYVALVEDVPGSPTGTIEAPLGRDPSRPMRRAVLQSGKHAVTHFELTEAFDNARCALLALRLETGRTHQIRVHLAAIGHPVIGDKVYGRPASVSSPRIFLHASTLEFGHPIEARTVEVVSPLPADLTGVLEGLRASNGN